MYYNFLIIILLCPGFGHGEEETARVVDDHPAECTSHEGAGEIVQCVGSKMMAGILTDTKARQDLFFAMKKTDVDTEMYGIGVELGPQPAIVAFRQTVYDIDRAYVKIPLSVMKIDAYVVLPRKTSKPTLILTSAKNDVPEYGSQYYQGSGSKTMAALYRHGKEPKTLDCANVLTDPTLRAFERATGQAMIIGKNLWCPDVMNKVYNMIEGDMVKEDVVVGGATAKAYVFVWAKGDGWQHGEPQSDFRM